MKTAKPCLMFSFLSVCCVINHVVQSVAEKPSGFSAALCIYIPMNHSFFQSVSVRKKLVIAPVHVRYSPFWTLETLKKSLHSSLPPSRLLHPRIPRTCKASFWSECSHLFLGFPTDLVLRNLDCTRIYVIS